MKRFASSMACIAMFGATVAGCGGGGSTSGNTTGEPGQASIVASQDGANAMVASIKDMSQQIAIAATLADILDYAAPLSGTYDCNTLPGAPGHIVDSGSGTVTLGVTVDTVTNLPVRSVVTFANCSYAIGQETFSFNGAATLTYEDYISPTQFVYSVAYDSISFSLTGPLSIVETLSGKESACTVGSLGTCTYVLNNVQMTALNAAAFNGSAVQVIGTQAIDARGQQFAFSSWTYDLTQPGDFAAAVRVTDAANNSASLTALFGAITYTEIVNSVSYTFEVSMAL